MHATRKTNDIKGGTINLLFQKVETNIPPSLVLKLTKCSIAVSQHRTSDAPLSLFLSNKNSSNGTGPADSLIALGVVKAAK